MEEQILANAELLRTIAREKLDVAVQFDEAGVRWLDGYIDRQRGQASADVKSLLPNTLGAFLGECIRHTYGGRWVQHPEHGWMVEIHSGFSVFPFTKVRKQLANHEGDSVLGLFTAIAPLLAGRSPHPALAAATAPIVKRPWWKFW